jgi:iron complex outermembrane receptor protein
MSTNRVKAVRTVLLLGGAAMVLPFAAAPAFAQSGASEEDASNTIIVTAQRRNERLEDVPMTVAVVTQESLASSGINSVRDLQNVTTGFLVNNSGNTPQPAIRGITTTNAGAYENNVALFVDGLYQVTAQVLNMDLPNVQDIQILKGPQGTLYGRNATGGAILINTIDPGNDWQGQVEATYGRFNDYRAKAFVAGPLSEKVGISLAGTLRHTDGYYKKASRTTPGQFDGNFLGLKQESLRAKLKFNLSETFTATAGYNYLRASDPRGVVFAYIENVAAPYTPGTGNATRPRGLGEAAGDVFDNTTKLHEGSLKLELDTGAGKLRSITGYTVARNTSTFDFGGSYASDNYSTGIVRDRTFQQSIDFNIDKIDRLNLVLGGNFYQIKTDYDPTPQTVLLSPSPAADPAVTTVPITDYRKFSESFFFRTKKAWALFADATFQATDQLSINVGGRYSQETQDVSGYKLNYSTVTGAVTSCSYSRTGEQNAGFTCFNGASAKQSRYSKFTPRASIRYELSPGTNIYASYSKGFRSGEWNTALPNDLPSRWFDVKQESVNAYEVGFKTAGSRLRFELAGFYYDYRDLQVSNTQVIQVSVGPPPVTIPLVILVNAPKARIYGVEGSFDYKLSDNFTVRGGVTWLDAKYGQGFYINAQGINPTGTGFNTNSDPLKVFPNRGVDQDLSGLQMARAPEFTGFLGFDYNVPNGDGGLRFSANVKYSSSYVVTNPAVYGGDRTYAARLSDADPSNNGPPINTESLAGTAYANVASVQRNRQGAYALVNASVTWTDPTDSYYVRVWGNNLSDVKYRVHYTNNGSGTYSPIGEPLTFGGTIGYKF